MNVLPDELASDPVSLSSDDIRVATIDLLRRWADQLEKGEASVATIEQRVDAGYYETTFLGKKFFYRKNPLMITLHLNLDVFTKEHEEAALKALQPENDRW